MDWKEFFKPTDKRLKIFAILIIGIYISPSSFTWLIMAYLARNLDSSIPYGPAQSDLLHTWTTLIPILNLVYYYILASLILRMIEGSKKKNKTTV